MAPARRAAATPRQSLMCATEADDTVLAIGGEINGETGQVTDSVLALQPD